VGTGIRWAVLGLLVVAWNVPAFAQPFKESNVPPWVSAALAQLAADGLIQGYPDGTFRGDRALTRDEMAVIVARVLAKVENLERPVPAAPTPARPPKTVSPPPSPRSPVSQADIDLLLRLVNELKDELADLDLRVPAVEAELQAIKPHIDNVRISGTTRFRENVGVGGSSTPVNGNPLTTNLSAGTAALANQAQFMFKLNFDAAVVSQVGPITVATGLPYIPNNLHFIAAVVTQGNLQTFNSGNLGTMTNAPLFGSQPANTAFGNGAFGSLDSAFLDWTREWGPVVAPTTLETWLGRFGANPQPNCVADCYPVQFGPFGLLMNDTGATWSDSTGDSGVNVADGLRVALHVPALADLQAQAVLIRVEGATGSAVGSEATLPVPGDSYIFGEDAYGVDANIQVNYWTRVGLDYVGNTITAPSNTSGPSGFGNAAQWHVYGPGGGALNPANLGTLGASSYHCVPVAGTGIACPAAGTGFGGYLDSDILKGVHFDGEYAQWNDAVFGTSDTGYQLNLIWSLGDITKINPPYNYNWSLQTGYVNYGQNFYPPYGAAEADAPMNDTIYPGNAQGFLATMSFSPVISKWTVYGTYFGGSSVSNAQPLSEYEVGVQYDFATNAQFWLLARSLNINGVQQLLLYRAQIDYYF